MKTLESSRLGIDRRDRNIKGYNGGQTRTVIPVIKDGRYRALMNKLTVVAVDPPDDEAASVTLRSETGEVVAFCHPCGLKAGDVMENRLSVLEADVISAYGYDWPEDEKTALSTEWLERTGHYAYRGRGRVIDQQEGLVEVLGFVIGMHTPCEGYVDFTIMRLDVGT